jgi:nucleolar protein 53
VIELPAITEPHQGTSYNPPVHAHTELIIKANEVEERRAKEAERLLDVKERISRAVAVSGAGEGGVGDMIVDNDVVSGEEEEVTGEEVLPAKKLPERKTKQQKTKAARLRAEVSHFIISASFTQPIYWI